MKQNLVGNAMVGLTGIMILAVVILCYAYVQDVRKSRRLQGQLLLAARNRTLAQALLAEAQEFAKKNKQMENVLQSLSRPAVETATNAPRPIVRTR